MAVEVETRGQVQEFLGLLSRRRWQILLPLFVILSLGVFFAVIVPKKYVVKTQIELRPVGVSVSAKEAANAQFQIKSRERIKKVAQELQNREYLALTPSQQQDWLEDEQKSVKVSTVQGTNSVTSFVNIEYSNVNPTWAVDFLRALRNDWTSDVIERDRNKVKEELATLRDARSRLDSQYKAAEEAYTEILRRHGLSATQPVPGQNATRTEDPVFERLRRNEGLYDEKQSELEQFRVILEDTRRRLNELPARIEMDETVVGGFSNDDEITKIELQILEAEKRLQGYRPTHSSYQKIQDELRSLESTREKLLRLTSKGELQRNSKPNPEIQPTRAGIDKLESGIRVATARRDSLAKEIETDRQKVEELQPIYGDVREKREAISRLTANLAVADAAYQAKSREVDHLMSPLANPFDITQEVYPPTKPTEPNPLLVISFALVAGIAIGLGTAVLLEYSSNGFRTVGDIGRVMAIPVLGSVQRIVTRREVRSVTVRRAAIGTVSVVFIGSVLFVTWAWANDAQYLSQDLRDSIEGLRAQLK